MLKLEGGIRGMENHPELLEHVGKFVANYEPERVKKGQQWLWTTDDPKQAIGFPDLREVHAYYKQDVGQRPYDMKPDRPITIYHVRVAKRKEFKKEVAKVDEVPSS